MLTSGQDLRRCSIHALQINLSSTWNNIDTAIKETLEFPKTHNIFIPKVKVWHLSEQVRVCNSANSSADLLVLQGHASGRRYEQTNADLIQWHVDLAKLHHTVQAENPVGRTSDSTLEFQFGEPLPRKSKWQQQLLCAVCYKFKYQGDHMSVLKFSLQALEPCMCH